MQKCAKSESRIVVSFRGDHFRLRAALRGDRRGILRRRILRQGHIRALTRFERAPQAIAMPGIDRDRAFGPDVISTIRARISSSVRPVRPPQAGNSQRPKPSSRDVPANRSCLRPRSRTAAASESTGFGALRSTTCRSRSAVRAISRCARFLLFQLIIRFAQPGGVEQPNRNAAKLITSSIVSRVVPGISLTMARSYPRSRLSRLDFPALVGP